MLWFFEIHLWVLKYTKPTYPVTSHSHTKCALLLKKSSSTTNEGDRNKGNETDSNNNINHKNNIHNNADNDINTNHDNKN